MTNSTFLANLYMLSHKNETDAGLDLMFEYFDEALNKEEFAKLDQLIQWVSPEHLNTSIRSGLLLCASWAEEHLPSYPTLYQEMVESVKGTNKEGMFKNFEPRNIA